MHDAHAQGQVQGQDRQDGHSHAVPWTLSTWTPDTCHACRGAPWTPAALGRPCQDPVHLANLSARPRPAPPPFGSCRQLAKGGVPRDPP
jgi:hypothetical protein